MLDGVGWTEAEIDDLWLSLEDTPPLDVEDTDPAPDPLPKDDNDLRSVVLALDPEDYDLFNKYVYFLEDKMGTKGLVSTVFETVKIAATEAGFEDK